MTRTRPLRATSDGYGPELTLIGTALAVIALCAILSVATLTLYPALKRSADNQEKAGASAIAVTENLERVSGDLGNASATPAEVAAGWATCSAGTIRRAGGRRIRSRGRAGTSLWLGAARSKGFRIPQFRRQQVGNAVGDRVTCVAETAGQRAGQRFASTGGGVSRRDAIHPQVQRAFADRAGDDVQQIEAHLGMCLRSAAAARQQQVDGQRPALRYRHTAEGLCCRLGPVDQNAHLKPYEHPPGIIVGIVALVL